MIKINTRGAIGVILDEYERAIMDLRQTIRDISGNELTTIADPTTADENCRSIESILTHVVNSGYSYAHYIRSLKQQNMEKPVKQFSPNISEYEKGLGDMFIFTVGVFETIDNKDIECFENSGKIRTAWGQYYDIEQLMEHAIVHILRHRRQIEGFKSVLWNENSN